MSLTQEKEELLELLHGTGMSLVDQRRVSEIARLPMTLREISNFARAKIVERKIELLTLEDFQLMTEEDAAAVAAMAHERLSEIFGSLSAPKTLRRMGPAKKVAK